MLHVEDTKAIGTRHLEILTRLNWVTCMQSSKMFVYMTMVSTIEPEKLLREFVSSHHMSYNINNLLYFALIIFYLKLMLQIIRIIAEKVSF